MGKELKKKSFIDIPNLIGITIGILVGRYSGLNLVIPVVGAFCGAFLFSRLIKKEKCKHFILPLSIQFGHLFWLSIGVILLPESLRFIILDVLLISIGLFWLIKKTGIKPVIYLIILQVISFISNLVGFTSSHFGTLEHKALLVHLIFRGLAIVFMITAYIQFKKETIVMSEEY